MRSIVLKAFIIFAFCSSSFITSANEYHFHPFYVSVTEMNYNPKSRALEISCKMFAEDIENVLKQNYKSNVDLGNDKMQAQNNNLMNDYMSKHLSFKVDSRAMGYKFVGYEKDKESVFCYLEVVNVPAMKTLSITNSILYDFKPEQINIMHVLKDGKRQSTKVDYPQNQANFNF